MRGGWARAVLVVSVVGLLGAGCSGADPASDGAATSTAVQTTMSPAGAQELLSNAEATAFVNSCLRSSEAADTAVTEPDPDSGIDYCTCVLRGLLTTMTVADVRAADQAVRGGQPVPAGVAEVVDACSTDVTRY